MTDEKRLITNIRLGDEKTFEFIFKKFFPGLCQFAFGIVRSKVIAEEIVEELFLHIWENATQIEISTSLKAYLYRSVYNRCLKYIRHVQVEKKHIDKVPYTFEDPELFGKIDSDFPLEKIIYEELAFEVDKAIQNLPDQCREIFSMHRHEELSYFEIAQKLNISINTVKTQMSRAIQKIKIAINGYL